MVLDDDMGNSERELSPLEESSMMRESILDGMTDSELAERSIRGRQELKGVDERLGKKVGEMVIKILEQIGLVDLARCGVPVVKIDVYGRISVSGKLGKFWDEKESLPIVELKAALGITSVNFLTSVNSFLVEFSLTDYRDARRVQEGIRSPEITGIRRVVKEGIGEIES